MNKESKQLLVKNKQNKSKKQDEKMKKKKANESSDDDDETYYPSEDSEGEEEVEMDSHEYRKFLQKIFPSKHLDKKIKAGEKLKKALGGVSQTCPNCPIPMEERIHGYGKGSLGASQSPAIPQRQR